MSYKLTALILTLAVLLTAASCSPAKTAGGDNETDAQSPSGVTEQPAGGSTFRLGRLPDYIAVPASAGAPARVYEGYTDVFYPSQSYGSVFIYEGSVISCTGGSGQSMNVTRYGICTGDGRIVTDAVFSAAYPVTLADGTVYYALEKLEQVKTDGKTEAKVTIFFISVNGAWSSGVYSAVGDGVTVIPLNNSGICMLIDSAGVFVKCYILNKNCDVLKFIAPSETVSYSFGTFSSGLCAVSETSDGKTEAYYIDTNGNKMFGGFSFAGKFMGERAVARDKDGDYIVIDTQGRTVAGPQKYNITNVGGSYFVCRDSRGTAVFDSSGTLLRVIETKGNVTVLGKTVPVILEESTGVYYSIFTGTALRCHNTGKTAQTYLGFGDYYAYFVTSEDGKKTAYIFDANGNFIYSVYNYGYVVNDRFYGDFIAVASGDDTGTVRIINLASHTQTAEIEAESIYPADADCMFALCTQRDSAGNTVRRIYEIQTMSVIAEGFDEAKVIKAGEQVYANCRSDGRLRLVLRGGTVLLDMPCMTSD